MAQNLVSNMSLANEIFAFNYTGGMSEVFFYYDKDTVYGARTDGDKKNIC